MLMSIQWLGQSLFKIRGKGIKLNIKPRKIEIDGFVITGPGEYEVKGASVLGINEIYLIELEGIRIGHLAKKTLTDQDLETINGLDILLVPAQMTRWVNEIEPKIVIPHSYTSAGQFLKDMGTTVKPIEKLLIKKKEMPQEGTQVCLLKKV